MPRILAVDDSVSMRGIIDSAALRQIDTAGLQLLAAFAVEIRRQGAPLVWPKPAPILCDAASVLGMARMLDLPS